MDGWADVGSGIIIGRVYRPLGSAVDCGDASRRDLQNQRKSFSRGRRRSAASARGYNHRQTMSASAGMNERPATETKSTSLNASGRNQLVWLGLLLLTWAVFWRVA